MFSGEKGNYEGWKAAFETCVDQAPVSVPYTLLQLKKYLSGEPLDMIKKLGHSERAYSVAKEKLDHRYGGKRRQIDVYLDQLETFMLLKEGDGRSFASIAELLETALFTLKEADRTEELGNGTLYNILL